MTTYQSRLLQQALDLLNQVNSSETNDPSTCPVGRFVQRFLTIQPQANIAVEELWEFYMDLSSTNEVEPLARSDFFRRLPTAIYSAFGVRKRHDLLRHGRRVRGFVGIDVRPDQGPP